MKHAFDPFRKRLIEVVYARKLRKISEQVGHLIDSFDVFDDASLAQLTSILLKYSEILDPWAERVGMHVIRETDAKNKEAWMRYSKEMSAGLRRHLAATPVGRDTVAELLKTQKTLIKSIPLDAIERVHKYVLEAKLTGSRDYARKMIQQTTGVSRSKAELVARTESARISTELTRFRAQSVGSPGYTWVTSHDGNVRESHKKMDGKLVSWDNPPTLDGLTGHAGCLPNCRCWARPILEDDEEVSQLASM